MEKEKHIELDQHFERGNLFEREDHMVLSRLMGTENQYEQVNHMEIGQDHLVFHQVAQLDPVDQAPLLVDQDQIGRN